MHSWVWEVCSSFQILSPHHIRWALGPFSYTCAVTSFLQIIHQDALENVKLSATSEVTTPPSSLWTDGVALQDLRQRKAFSGGESGD